MFQQKSDMLLTPHHNSKLEDRPNPAMICLVQLVKHSFVYSVLIVGPVYYQLRWDRGKKLLEILLLSAICYRSNQFFDFWQSSLNLGLEIGFLGRIR